MGKDAKRMMEFLRCVSRKFSLLQKDQACCCGTTLPQSEAILEIANHGEISLAQLASNLGLDKSTMSRTVNNLVQMSLVKRVDDPKDRRFVVLCLTEKGHETLKLLQGQILNYYQRVLDIIPQDKQDQVLKSIELLERALSLAGCTCGKENCTCGRE